MHVDHVCQEVQWHVQKKLHCGCASGLSWSVTWSYSSCRSIGRRILALGNAPMVKQGVHKKVIIGIR